MGLLRGVVRVLMVRGVVACAYRIVAYPRAFRPKLLYALRSVAHVSRIVACVACVCRVSVVCALCNIVQDTRTLILSRGLNTFAAWAKP